MDEKLMHDRISHPQEAGCVLEIAPTIPFTPRACLLLGDRYREIAGDGFVE
jgi:hypothetical protein